MPSAAYKLAQVLAERVDAMCLLRFQLGSRVRQQLRPVLRSRGMNLLRRMQIGAGVMVATAAVGAVSGVIVASTLLATQLGHIHPSTVWEVIKLGSQTGAIAGSMLGTPLTFALLRRGPFSHIATNALVGATYGGIVGYACSLAFVQPRPSVALMLAGSCVGAGMAAARLWTTFRGARGAAPVPSAG